MADAVSGVVGFGIGAVRDVADAVFFAPFSNLVAACVYERSEISSVAERIDAAESSQSSAAHEVEEHRFEIVVGVMSGCDDCALSVTREFFGDGIEEIVSHLTRGLFDVSDIHSPICALAPCMYRLTCCVYGSLPVSLYRLKGLNA